jgi:signal transduction histidine kinase
VNSFASNAFIGIFAVFCIIFIIQYFAYKRNEYLAYGLYLFVLVVYYTLFTTTLIIDEANYTKGEASTLKQSIANLAIVVYVFFVVFLLDSKKYSQRLHAFNLLMIGLNLFGIPLYIILFLFDISHQQFYYYANILFGVLSIYFLYLALKLKLPYTKYVIIGTLFSTIGGIWSIILSIQKSPNSFFPGQLAIVIDVILFFYATQKKVIDLRSENIELKFKTITELQNERQRISLELHDEVGGGLSSIHLLSELSKNKNSEYKHLDRISQNSKELVQKMNEIVWALNNKNDSLQGLIAYIRQYVVQTFDELEIDIKANVTQDIPIVAIDGKHRRSVFLMVKELVNNIIKHSRATNVNMNVVLQHKCLVILLQDNGIGFDEHKIKTNSFGILGLQERAKKLGGNINWVVNSGTMSEITIPLEAISYKSAIEIL